MRQGIGCSTSPSGKPGREGKGIGGHTCRMLVAGEDLSKSAANPVAAARKDWKAAEERKTELGRPGPEGSEGNSFV